MLPAFYNNCEVYFEFHNTVISLCSSVRRSSWYQVFLSSDSTKFIIKRPSSCDGKKVSKTVRPYRYCAQNFGWNFLPNKNAFRMQQIFVIVTDFLSTLYILSLPPALLRNKPQKWSLNLFTSPVVLNSKVISQLKK